MYFNKRRSGGYIGLVSLLISLAIIGFMIYLYLGNGENPQSATNQIERGQSGINEASNIQIQAEAKAKATNEMMEGL